ncbi:DMT family transporter [Bosea sp. (in: a-proteobacteria)]|uniref:DMT family transporter n=1 Tax=Bosea sp. (in: a-proteobacteria) TaxID=1871050 RepID=UPI0031FE5B4C
MRIAVLSNSLYGVMLKHWPMAMSLWHQLFWQIFFSVIMLLPIWVMWPISPITATNLPLIPFAAIPTLIAPIYWIIGVHRLGVARVALLINVMPISTVVLACSILGEELYHITYRRCDCAAGREHGPSGHETSGKRMLTPSFAAMPSRAPI